MKIGVLRSLVLLVAGATLAAALAAMTLAQPGGASAPVCRYAPPPKELSPQEKRLRETIDQRMRYGFSQDRAFVRRVNSDRAARRRGVERNLPVTAPEAAYLRLRTRVEDAASAPGLQAYLRRHATRLGGLSIEDDYPRSPYVLVHVTGDVDRHRRAIAGLMRVRFVVRRARYSERDLGRIQDAVIDDSEELERQGITVLLAYPKPDRVHVEVATPRTDVKAFMRRRYGAVVAVRVVGRTPTFLECAPVRTYRVDDDGRTLDITFTGSSSFTPQRVEVVETPAEVRLGAVFEAPRGFINADLATHRLSVALAEPVGTRAVKSITTRKPVAPERAR